MNKDKLIDEIMQELEKDGCVVFRVNDEQFSFDIVGHRADGQAFFLIVPCGEKLTYGDYLTVKRVQERQGIADVVKSVEEATRAVNADSRLLLRHWVSQILPITNQMITLGLEAYEHMVLGEIEKTHHALDAFAGNHRTLTSLYVKIDEYK